MSAQTATDIAWVGVFNRPHVQRPERHLVAPDRPTIQYPADVGGRHAWALCGASVFEPAQRTAARALPLCPDCEAHQ